MEEIKFSRRIQFKGLEGTVEEWFCWKWTDYKAARRIGKFMETNSNTPWLEVAKERRKYLFQLV